MERLDRKQLLAGAGLGAVGLVGAPATAGADGDRRRHPAERTWRIHATWTSSTGATFDTSAMAMYLPGGMAIESASSTPAPSVGSWRGLSRRRFRARFRRFNFTPDGGLVGFQGLVLDGQVDVAGDSFHGRGTAQNYDTLGAPVGSPFELTVEATRFRVD